MVAQEEKYHVEEFQVDQVLMVLIDHLVVEVSVEAVVAVVTWRPCFMSTRDATAFRLIKDLSHQPHPTTASLAIPARHRQPPAACHWAGAIP